MPSVTYMNNSAPFWDFIASLEQGSQNNPFVPQNQSGNETDGERGEHQHHHRGPPPPGPWGWGFPSWGGSHDLPHRGPPPANDQTAEEGQDEKAKDNTGKDNTNDNGEGPSNSCNSDNEGCSHRRSGHGRCGGGRRGRHGWGPYGRGGFGGGHGHRGPHHHGRGGWGPWARGGPFNVGPSSFNPFEFAAGLFDPTAANDNSSSEDFTPEADIFDTPSAFIIHISLPGAKKEDVGVNWDLEKSELSVAGVVYRPADEELLKLLDVSERKVGPFERKIRLGTRANPAQIDSEGITAKLEDGVLRIEVPKLEKEGFVEVRKVDIE